MDESADIAPKSERGFWALVGVQFQGVLSDTLFKMLLVLLILSGYGSGDNSTGFWQPAVQGAFVIAFLVFSGFAGLAADKWSRRSVVLASKAAEVGVMILGVGAAWYYARVFSSTETAGIWALGALMFVLFLSAIQTAIFSPSKYALISDLVEPARRSWAVGIIGLTMLSAVVAGILGAGGLFVVFGPERIHLAFAALTALSLAGLLTATMIDRGGAADPEARIRFSPDQVRADITSILNSRVMIVTVMGIAFIWAIGAIFLLNVPEWGREALGLPLPALNGNNGGAGFFNFITSNAMIVAPLLIGIALGMYGAGIMSGKETELGFVPLGGVGMAFFCLFLGLPEVDGASGEFVRASIVTISFMAACLLMTGVAMGYYAVPLYAQLLDRIEPERRGRTLAAVNVINFCAVAGAAVIYWALTWAFHLTPSNIFVLCSLLTLGMTLFLIAILPEIMLGLVSTVITRFLYRIRVMGGGNIPTEGAAILVSNHISMVDALLILSVSPRPVRFIVWKEIFDNPYLGYFLKTMNAIPISSDQRPRAMIAALSKAADALNNGELVCVFAEGQTTRAGLPVPYRRGFRHVLSKAPVPVVPIYLDGVWGSIFKYEKGKFLWEWPRKFPYQVTIAIGKLLPHNVSMHEMRQNVMNLNSDCAIANKEFSEPIHHRFINMARKNPNLFCIADQNTDPLTFGRALIGGMVIARRLRKHWGDQEMVGIYLPPTVAGVLVNIAVTISGRVAVNLNYTLGRETLEHCINLCGIKTVITSRLFLKKLGQEPPPGAVYMEDVMKDRPNPKTLRGLRELLPIMAAAKALSLRAIESFCGAMRHPTPDDLATIIFSSGSTGVPKGIMLSHFNISSNITGFNQRVSLWTDDKVIGFLPFFHSFGFTVSLWGSLNIGYGVIHHPNPVEAKVIGDLVEKYKITVMIATPTFLQTYIRRVEPLKFKSLEFIMTGAEKLSDRVADGFEERFGQYVYEGYGTTECSPVVAANVDDYRNRGHHLVSNKRGSVGMPLPGITIQVRDVDSGDLMPSFHTGMIFARGPNIMKGYYKEPEKTAEVLIDGWYETGDLGFLDDDGFLHITGRLSRFSKIGGEMVPHMRIEDELHKILGLNDELAFAVAGIPDQAKGEKLVVLHTVHEERLDSIGDKLADAGVPNLWIPKRTMYFRVEEIPILGTGKMDLKQVNDLAAAMAAEHTVGAEADK